jgi:peptide/nickel transport system substrate-binding protein
LELPLPRYRVGVEGLLSGKSRLLASAAGLAAALVVLGGAGAAPAGSGGYGGALTVGLTRGAYDTLDPTTEASFSSVEIFRAIMLRLYDFDAKGNIYPELAAKLPTISPDGRTYTIALRQGVLFNDGTPFNAQAVVTTLERDINLPTSQRASDLSPVSSITTSGPYTVVIHLNQRFTPLLQNLATNDGIIMSPTQLQKLGTNFGSDPIGVGPFMYDSQVPGVSVTVVKSPYFYDQLAVHLDKIVFQNESSGGAGLEDLEAGDIQILDGVSPTQIQAAQQAGGIHLIKVDSLGWLGIQFNIGNYGGMGTPFENVGTPLASSALLRQAFEEAIDRKTLVNVVFDGAGVPDCTPIAPASTTIYDPTVKCTPYDPQNARKLVAESGIPDPTVNLDSVGNSTLDQFIQSEEQAVGINVTINTISEPLMTAVQSAGHFDAMVTGWTGSPALDRNVFQWLATSGSRNFGGYSNPRLDEILANARKATSAKALKVLWHAAFKIMIDDRPIIFLYHPIVYAAVAGNVKGVEFLQDVQARVDFAQYA